MSIATLLARHAQYRPHYLGVVFENHRLTFQQFDARVNRLANALLAAGHVKGDKIATVLPNCLEQLEVYWAAAKTGLVVVPMSPLLQEPGLRSLLEDSDSMLVVSTREFAATLGRLRVTLPAIRSDRWLLTDGVHPEFATYAAFVAGASENSPPENTIAGSDPYNAHNRFARRRDPHHEADGRSSSGPGGDFRPRLESVGGLRRPDPPCQAPDGGGRRY